MTSIDFDYLENTTAGRNAFYLVIPFNNGKSLYAYGTIGQSGRVAVDSASKLGKRVLEKLSKGYQDVKHKKNISQALAFKAEEEFRKQTGRTISYVNGQFVENGTASNAGLPRPKLRKGKSDLDRWF